MIETKDLFSDGQGTLVERQGLLVLALAIVEGCQVVECVSRYRGAQGQAPFL